jgi:hypothetical protein
MKILKPFAILNNSYKTFIVLFWILSILILWSINSLFGEIHLFPTITQVLYGLVELYNDGLIVHIFASLFLCFKAVLFSTFISLFFAYSIPLPLLKPVSTFITKLRYLPLTGLSYYISIIFTDARDIQVWV